MRSRPRKLWERLIEIRFRTGEPYLNFIDTANADLPQPLKDRGLKIHGSNLCNEIHLPTNEDRTAVCCLSSLNLEYYDDWKDTTIVRDITRMLDNVLQYFIENAPDTISRAKYSAERERSIGIGAMGFHSLLQRHGVAWESEAAREINRTVFAHIKSEAVLETELLATERGSYPDGEDSGRRNSHLLAIAPNASSGVIFLFILFIALYIFSAFKTKSKLASNLILANAKNQELKKEKDDFLAYTTHEIRTPLSAVISASEILDRTKLDSSQKEHLKAFKSF